MVKHRAFIDLENALSTRCRAAWKKTWQPLQQLIALAVQDKNWAKANELVDILNLDQLVIDTAEYAQTIGIASLLLGASRLEDVKNSHVAKHLPVHELGNGLAQWGKTITRNLPQLLKRSLHEKLAQLEHDTEQTRHTIQKDAAEQLDLEFGDVLSGIEVNGADFMSLTASLMVSRLSSFGFLAEAANQGITQYEISAILDDHTCPICEILDGQVFEVADGVAQASAIMQADDADSLKSIAPWPSQSKQGVLALKDATTQDLIDEGLQLPPYHAYCRCIAVEVSSEAGDTEEAGLSAGDAETLADDEPSIALPILLGLLAGIAVGRTKDAAQAGLQEEEYDPELQPDDEGYDPDQDPLWVNPDTPNDDLTPEQRKHRQAQIDEGWQV